MTAAIPVQVTRFRCPFCRRSWSSKARANEHVATCWRDPAQRSCKTCLHHDEGQAHGYDEPGWPEGCGVATEFTIGPAGNFDIGRGEPMFFDRDRVGRTASELADEGWWPQRNCPLWEPAAWVKEPAW